MDVNSVWQYMFCLASAFRFACGKGKSVKGLCSPAAVNCGEMSVVNKMAPSCIDGGVGREKKLQEQKVFLIMYSARFATVSH